jgi:hypothetical protein
MTRPKTGAPPTALQMKVLTYVLDYQLEHGRKPTYPEIAVRFGWNSSSSALNKIYVLLRKGYLIEQDNLYEATEKCGRP